MASQDDLNNKRVKIEGEYIGNDRNKSDIKVENRQQTSNPEILTNPIYTPGFLRTQIGKLMRIEFLIGTNNMVDRIGFLEDVGASYILLRSFEGDSMIYADIYAIKFITISATYSGMPSFQNYNGYPSFNTNQNMNNRY